MGNLFSNLFDSNVTTSAPSASYTITPASTTTNTTTTTNSSSPSSSPGSCPAGTTSTSSTTTTTATSIQNAPSAMPFQGSSDNEFIDFLNDIFNATTYTILFWILTLYICYRFINAIFANRGTSNETSGVSSYSRTIDIVLAIIIVINVFGAYYSLDQSDKDNIFGYTLEWTETWLNDPWSLFGVIWFTIIFFLMVYLLRVPMDPAVKPVIVHFIEHKIWIVYATFAVIFFFKYVLQVPIVTLLFNNGIVNYFKTVPPFSSDSPSIFQSIEQDLGVTPSSSTVTTQDILLTSAPSPASCETINQVFNVSNNLYTYEEAQKVCAAFDASLATYDQIETSYQNGGEWCNYGWSDGQMAYFPTQKDTWEKLQNNPNTKHACGRPGINGGFIDNPYIKFGANCYGKKPPQPADWKPNSLFEQCQATNPAADEMNKLRNQADLNSFNNKKWSRY
jgi:hypothetical protein